MIIKIKILTILFLSTFLFGCYIRIFNFGSYKYTGDIDLSKYQWLKDKKIFLDPGYDGKADKNKFTSRQKNNDVRDINLKIALILSDMLEKAGATVSISRKKNFNISIDDSNEKVHRFNPDLLISLNHNISQKQMDKENYPVVLIWGNKKFNQLSYSFAELLIDEFNRIMDKKGTVISDFVIYPESGTTILNETRNICPGVIGIPGFFTDPDNAVILNDNQYNMEEAEAYFNAIAQFFERGIPNAEILVSSPVDNESNFLGLIKDNDPTIAIKTVSGIEGQGIINSSLNATLDGIPVICKPVADNLFFIDYGKKLYPGFHVIRFSFLNKRHQSSMIFSSDFSVDTAKGDYDKLKTEGIKLIQNKQKRKEALKMLASALSIEPLDPDSDKIIWNMAKGFDLIGDRTNSNYYYERLYHFYPQSKYIFKLHNRFKGYRFPVEYNVKKINIKHEPSLKDESRRK